MIKHKLMLLVLLSVLLAACAEVPNSPSVQSPEAFFSVWYWLNAVEKDRWDEDLKRIADSGFTHVILCWGYDLSAFRLRKNDSLEALRLSQKHGLGGFLLIWHPVHNSLVLEAKPEHLQIDNEGHSRFSLNLYNQEWRQTQWKDYLQEIAQAYKDAPAMAGYVLDDTFFPGPVSSFGGTPGVEGGDFFSYSPADQKQFRQWLSQKYGSLSELNQAWASNYATWEEIHAPTRIEKETVWTDWVNARTHWLKEWASETMGFIREIDANRDHIVYIEDTASKLGLNPRPSQYSPRPVTVVDTFGLRFGEVAQAFDLLGAYTAFGWKEGYSVEKAIEETEKVIAETRRQSGSTDKLVYTFWVSDIHQVFGEGPVNRPTAQEIWAITETALDQGVRYIDYYAYDVGDPIFADEEEWKKFLPGTGPDYPLAKQYQGKWLTHRPETMEELGNYLKRYQTTRRQAR